MNKKKERWKDESKGERTLENDEFLSENTIEMLDKQNNKGECVISLIVYWSNSRVVQLYYLRYTDSSSSIPKSVFFFFFLWIRESPTWNGLIIVSYFRVLSKSIENILEISVTWLGYTIKILYAT